MCNPLLASSSTCGFHRMVAPAAARALQTLGSSARARTSTLLTRSGCAGARAPRARAQGQRDSRTGRRTVAAPRVVALVIGASRMPRHPHGDGAGVGLCAPGCAGRERVAQRAPRTRAPGGAGRRARPPGKARIAGQGPGSTFWLMSWRRISLLSASTFTSGRSMPSGSAMFFRFGRTYQAGHELAKTTRLLVYASSTPHAPSQDEDHDRS
jgi:hypothetical protein